LPYVIVITRVRVAHTPVAAARHGRVRSGAGAGPLAQSAGVTVNLLKMVQNWLYDCGYMVINPKDLPDPAHGPPGSIGRIRIVGRISTNAGVAA
jgi:hypothetical protein